MKIVNYEWNGQNRTACVQEGKVYDLNRAYESVLRAEGHPRAEAWANVMVPHNIIEFLEGGDGTMELAKKSVEFVRSASGQMDPSGIVFSREDVRLKAPVLKPNKIICVGHNYKDHILEMGRELPEYPVAFAKFNNTIIGPEDDIPLPDITNQLDYEAEFAIVIGRKARNVSYDEARDYVAGYTIANDITARDMQRRTIQWLQGKTLDGSAPLGPWLVTRDEIQDPHNLEVVLHVNGEERQRANTKNLVFNVNRLIEFFSEILTLEPGDVILSGTPGGVGFARNPQVFLKDGDEVRIEVENIGVLKNTVRKVNP